MRTQERKQSANDILLSLLENTIRSVSEPLKKNDKFWGHKVDSSSPWTGVGGGNKHVVTISLTYMQDKKIVLYHAESNSTMTRALMEAVLYFSNAGAFYAYKAKLDELKKKTELAHEAVNEHN
jgi:hypothetical protein